MVRLRSGSGRVAGPNSQSRGRRGADRGEHALLETKQPHTASSTWAAGRGLQCTLQCSEKISRVDLLRPRLRVRLGGSQRGACGGECKGGQPHVPWWLCVPQIPQTCSACA